MNYLLFEDTTLNPNNKIVNAINNRLVKNDGYCPCYQENTPKEDTKCPCSRYYETHYCCCTLYVKK